MTIITIPRIFGSVVILTPQPAQYINVTWVTRDMIASWKTRDDRSDNWQARDEQAIWQTIERR